MNWWRYIFVILILALVVVWAGALRPVDEHLHIVACDVGQGDAILIYQGNNQILVDGGPGNSAVECLGRHVAFWDRSIELVVLTHPQSDHYSGLIEVFEQYEVEMLVATEADNSTKGYGVLKEMVGGRGVLVVNPKEGMEVRLGLMSLDILWPSHPACGLAADVQNRGVLGACAVKGDLNDLSVVFELQYGEFEALFTGDIGPTVIGDLAGVGDVEYLKVPHHGSKNGLTAELLEASKPEIAVISAGANNRYGHPHSQVLEMLERAGVQVERTDLSGDVEVISDGEVFWVRIQHGY